MFSRCVSVVEGLGTAAVLLAGLHFQLATQAGVESWCPGVCSGDVVVVGSFLGGGFSTVF